MCDIFWVFKGTLNYAICMAYINTRSTHYALSFCNFRPLSAFFHQEKLQLMTTK